ncbi:hypothetical protein QFC20_000321 [Naganishia adeliensis]|uniref:Uncharacterized protein n=1 Tax=Naganishia adeliensis TaxID=92952 RepID=A0ACC2X092_9TREE|nr:hypothetical protein QFC20_000321 [Naganishia adeliensis]
MRLTPEVMARSQTHLNPLKERELDLRGLQIPLIENLASHQGTYDTLNFTDNSLVSLGNIPLAPRIRTIHAGLNNIATIAPNLASTVPHLETLGTKDVHKHNALTLILLTSNNLATFASLLPLANFSKLEHLSLIGNPVRSQKYYREWVIWKVAKGKLRTLDFKRIKDAERDHARSLFVDEETGLPSKLALSLTSDATTAAQSATAAVSTETGAQGDVSKGRLMTAEEKTKIREAIQKAENIEEIRKLERMLAEGRMPAGEKA